MVKLFVSRRGYMKREPKMKNWIQLCSDVNWEDYHGMWCKQASDGSWWVIRWTNMYDAMGEDECKSNNYPQYHCAVLRLEFPFPFNPDESVIAALRSCGYTWLAMGLMNDQGEMVEDQYVPLVMVECCISYGLGAPMSEFESDTYPMRLRARARKYAESMMKDSSATKERLQRPVNALGSTAEEYGRGDIDSAMMRGKSEAHKLMRKISGIKE